MSEYLMKISGRCLCGGLIFEIAPKSGEIYKCHCSKRRKLSGSSSNANIIVSKNEFDWIKPARTLKKYTMYDGWESVFCSNCGSIAPQEVDSEGIVYVPAGLLAEHDSLRVTKHIYIGSKASWDRVDNEINQFDKSG